MPVFISHRHTDSIKAANISRQLQIAGIQNYLDVLDPDAQKVDDITSHITEKMKICTHIIAVVSRETALSWWVPFEIGEATITNRRIASYRTSILRLPEYLEMWPQMSELSHLDLFINEYLSQKQHGLFESSGSRSSTASINDEARMAREFHSNLKARLGPRP